MTSVLSSLFDHPDHVRGIIMINRHKCLLLRMSRNFSTGYLSKVSNVLVIKSHRKLQIVSPKIASHQNGAFLACSDREVCITENCKCIIENCKRITENCKEVSPINARKYHRKLQAQSILIHDKKTWETPGGVPTYRRAFYVGSVGCLQCLLMPVFCQSKNLPSFLSY